MARLVFLGTPEVATPTLVALVEAGHDVAAVVTRPDRRRSRGAAPSPSPVKAAATALGLAVTHTLEDVTELGAELGVVVAYGRLIPARVLAAVPMINVHFSLLPRWRGAAPVQRAIVAGDQVTGVCVMALEPELDTGPIYAQAQVTIGPEETADALAWRLAGLGAELVVELLAHGARSLPQPTAQSGEVTYAPKLTAAEFELDFERPAEELVRWVRLGRAFTTWRGRRLRVLRAAAQPGSPASGPPGTVGPEGVATASGVLGLAEVAPEGRRSMSWTEWLRGARAQVGERLGP